MADDKNPSATDLLGIAPYGEAVKIVVDRGTVGLGHFLSWICKPAAEELGLLFRDKIRAWRGVNAERIAGETIRILVEGGVEPTMLAAPPQVVQAILDHGSWTDDELLQHLWAGLLASSCTPEGNDMRGLKFIDFLRRLSSSEARLLQFSCRNCPKTLTAKGLLIANEFQVPLAEVRRVTGLESLEDIDTELDHLRHLGLLAELSSGIDPHSEELEANITPSAFGLYLFARCSGARLAKDFYADAERKPVEV